MHCQNSQRHHFTSPVKQKQKAGGIIASLFQTNPNLDYQQTYYQRIYPSVCQLLLNFDILPKNYRQQTLSQTDTVLQSWQMCIRRRPNVYNFLLV